MINIEQFSTIVANKINIGVKFEHFQKYQKQTSYSWTAELAFCYKRLVSIWLVRVLYLFGIIPFFVMFTLLHVSFSLSSGTFPAWIRAVWKNTKCHPNDKKNRRKQCDLGHMKINDEYNMKW